MNLALTQGKSIISWGSEQQVRAAVKFKQTRWNAPYTSPRSSNPILERFRFTHGFAEYNSSSESVTG